MIKTSVLFFIIFHFVQGSNLNETVNYFKDEVNGIVSSEGAQLMARLEEGVIELQGRVSQHLNEIYESIEKAYPTSRTRRSAEQPVNRGSRPRFSIIINMVTCTYLSTAAVEISSVIGDSAYLVAKAINTTTNYSTALSNCSGNPLCVMSMTVFAGQAIKDISDEIMSFIANLKSRTQRIISIVVSCARGEDWPTPSSPPQINNTTEQPNLNTSTQHSNNSTIPQITTVASATNQETSTLKQYQFETDYEDESNELDAEEFQIGRRYHYKGYRN